jgi:hypothetical protein
MPDTGLPWEIPYAAPADLVRDWPALSEDVADAVAAGLSAAGPAGIGSNVVQTVKTDTFTTSSTSFTDVTGLTATITPSSATSKILVIANVSFSISVPGSSGRAAQIRLTGGGADTYVGNAAGSRLAVAAQTGENFTASHDVSRGEQNATLVYVSSPNTTSPVTFKVQMRQNDGTGVVNRTGNDTDSVYYSRTPSSITAIEVAA